MVTQRHRECNVLVAADGQDQVPLTHKLWRLFLIEPSRCQQYSLHRAEHKATGHDLLAGRSAQGLNQTRRTLHGSVEEGVQSAGLHGNLTLAVEVHRQVLGDGCGLFLANAFVECGLVCRQTDSVFHRIVVVTQPVKRSASSSLKLALFDLVQLCLQSFCTLL